MRYSKILTVVLVACSIAAQAQSESSNRCADLKSAKIAGVEITNSELVPSGKTIAPAYPGASGIGPLPAHCRIDGMINRRKGTWNTASGFQLLFRSQMSGTATS